MVSDSVSLSVIRRISVCLYVWGFFFIFSPLFFPFFPFVCFGPSVTVFWKFQPIFKNPHAPLFNIFYFKYKWEKYIKTISGLLLICEGLWEKQWDFVKLWIWVVPVPSFLNYFQIFTKFFLIFKILLSSYFLKNKIAWILR